MKKKCPFCNHALHYKVDTKSLTRDYYCKCSHCKNKYNYTTYLLRYSLDDRLTNDDRLMTVDIVLEYKNKIYHINDDMNSISLDELKLTDNLTFKYFNTHPILNLQKKCLSI